MSTIDWLVMLCTAICLIALMRRLARPRHQQRHWCQIHQRRMLPTLCDTGWVCPECSSEAVDAARRREL